MRPGLTSVSVTDLDTGEAGEETEVLSETEIPVTDSRDSTVENVARTVLNNQIHNPIDNHINNHIDDKNHPQNNSHSESSKSGDMISLNSTESQYMLVSVVVLVTIIIILIITIIFILYKNHQYSRGKGGESSEQSDSARYPLYSPCDRESFPGSTQVRPNSLLKKVRPKCPIVAKNFPDLNAYRLRALRYTDASRLD